MSDRDSDRAPRWRVAASSTDATLHDVVHTANGPYAVGESGVLLARRPEARGRDWEAVFKDGPATRNRRLNAVATTKTGRRIWYAGESGALGYYDLDRGRKYNCSAPNGVTNEFTAITVTGYRGQEGVTAADSSGQLVNVSPADGMAIRGPRKPASSGASVTGLDVSADQRLVAVNAAGELLTTTDGFDWTCRSVVDTSIVDVQAGDGSALLLSSGGTGSHVDLRTGRVVTAFTRDWSPSALATGDFGTCLAGPNGRIERSTGDGWVRESTGASVALDGLALGTPPVAVGADGTVLERR